MSDTKDDAKEMTMDEMTVMKRLLHATEMQVLAHDSNFHVCGACGCQLVRPGAKACPVCDASETCESDGVTAFVPGTTLQGRERHGCHTHDLAVMEEKAAAVRKASDVAREAGMAAGLKDAELAAAITKAEDAARDAA